MADKCNGCGSLLFCMSVAETNEEDFEVYAEKRDCKKRTMTNGDKIRSMTDEELAHELALIAGWDRKQFAKAKSIGIEKFMLDWLWKQVEAN